ncbi:MAG: hypothetical protein J3K34DRAFT_403243 [Monoraphidium minutum]|nr:MAG: hypothetical protein J3K34DRAFT_403243 [Monoraphidium minutum]
MASGLFVVTGGSTGLGLHAALTLAAQGATVVIAARSAGPLAAAVERANAAGAAAGGTAVGLPLDLSSLADVTRFAGELLAKFPGREVQGLLLNAGINTRKFGWSADGVEMTWATNHLGHAVLAQLLLPHMAASGRILVTSSGTHDPAVKAPLPEPKYGSPAEVAMLRSDLGGVPPASFDGGLAYTRSKLCNLLFTYHLARRLAADGSGVTVNGYDPGFCPDTELAKEIPGVVRGLFRVMVPLYMRLVGSPQRPSTAAASGAFMARLGSDAEFVGVSGRYFSIAAEEPSSPASRDEARQDEMAAYTQGLLAALAGGGGAAATTAT